MKQDFDRNSPREHNLRLQFLTAAENGAVEMARDILYQGALNAETLDHALGLAAGQGQVGFVDFLIHEVQMDLSRSGGEVLAQAVRDREIDVVDMLTRDDDLSLNPRNIMDTHYLDLALVGTSPYSPALLQLLLDRGAAPLHVGFDSVNIAVREKNSDALQRFLKQDPAIADRLGEKLVSAAMRLDPDAVEFLIKNGAPIAHARNAPLRHLVETISDLPGRDPERAFRCTELLLDAGASDADAEADLMKAAVRAKNAPLIRRLLDRDVDIEPEMRGTGYNRMVLAATYGFSDLVGKYHADGTIEPHAYEEALGTAAEHGHGGIVDQLLRYGANTAHTDVVFCAAVGGQVDLVKSLVARGNTTDFKCKTLLEAVIEGNHGPMLDYLFDQGADRERAHELYIAQSNRDRKPYAEIYDTLKAWSERGQTVVYAIPSFQTLSDLRATEQDHRGHPTSLLVRLAKINRIDEAVALARASANDQLKVDDLLATDGAGNTVVEILGARGHLGKLFVADLWENRQADFATLYAGVPPVYQDQIDEQGMVSTWRRRALAGVKDKIPRLKKG